MKYVWGIFFFAWLGLWVYVMFFDAGATQGEKLGLLALMLITGHLAFDSK